MTLPLLLALLSAEPRSAIELTVNRSTIKQCDPLLVKAVVSDSGEGLWSIESPSAIGGNRIRYQWRVDGQWKPLQTMSSFGLIGLPSPHKPLLIAEGAEYAEYDRILLQSRKKDPFVFDQPGRYEISAVVETFDGKFESKPLTIVVERRTAADVKRIEHLKKTLFLIGYTGSNLEVPPELYALDDIGGNIGHGVRNLKFLEGILSGNEPLVEDSVPKTVRQRMDGVEAEMAMILLGHHYRQKGDWKHLDQIVEALPPTLASFSWHKDLERRRPAAFVPNRASDQP